MSRKPSPPTITKTPQEWINYALATITSKYPHLTTEEVEDLSEFVLEKLTVAGFFTGKVQHQASYLFRTIFTCSYDEMKKREKKVEMVPFDEADLSDLPDTVERLSNDIYIDTLWIDQILEQLSANEQIMLIFCLNSPLDWRKDALQFFPKWEVNLFEDIIKDILLDMMPERVSDLLLQEASRKVS